MNRIFSAFTAILLTLSLTACGAAKTAPPRLLTILPPQPVRMSRSASVSPAPLTGHLGTRRGGTGAGGIHLEFVQFSNFSLPNDALNSGDIDLNAFQHHAFLENEIANYGYDITAIGDTYVVAMNVYSDKINDLSELKDGDKIAIPNDATNEGRALKLLESAGILELDPAAAHLPPLRTLRAIRCRSSLWR